MRGVWGGMIEVMNILIFRFMVGRFSQEHIRTDAPMSSLFNSPSFALCNVVAHIVDFLRDLSLFRKASMCVC